jgi:tRNA synthetases class I (M)
VTSSLRRAGSHRFQSRAARRLCGTAAGRTTAILAELSRGRLSTRWGHGARHGDATRKSSRIASENWFFRLSRYIQAAIASDQLQILPKERKNEVSRFVAGGLEDFSISRSPARAKGWAIAVPGDDSQIVYVWFDALANYLSVLEFPSGELCDRYWHHARERWHVLGKDILRFRVAGPGDRPPGYELSLARGRHPPAQAPVHRRPRRMATTLGRAAPFISVSPALL